MSGRWMQCVYVALIHIGGHEKKKTVFSLLEERDNSCSGWHAEQVAAAVHHQLGVPMQKLQ